MRLRYCLLLVAGLVACNSGNKAPPAPEPVAVTADGSVLKNKEAKKVFSRAMPKKLKVSAATFPEGCVTSGVFPGAAATTGPALPSGTLNIMMDGQSNMAGQEVLRPADSGVIPGVWLRGFQVDYPASVVKQWEPAVEPLNRYSTYRGQEDKAGFGPMQSFLRRVHEVTGQEIALIADAQPSTKISLFYDGSVVAKDRLQRYPGIRVDAIIWNQGEADRTDAAYLAKLKTMIAQRRALFKAPCMPFIASEILPGEPGCTTGQLPDYGKVINDQLAQLPSQVPYTAVSSAAGLHAYPACNIHYDHNGYSEMGVRMANVFLCLTGRLTDPAICTPDAVPDMATTQDMAQ